MRTGRVTGSNSRAKKSPEQSKLCPGMVEMAVIETASENPSAQLSTSVADLLAIPLGERQSAGSPVR